MKKNRSWKGILIIVLLLAIGFAAVTTTLFINGTINFGANPDDFKANLKFTAAKLEYSDTNKATVEHSDTTKLISDDGKTITFTVDPLTTIGETAKLTYEISNTSQYDAKLQEIACTVKKDVPADNAEGGTNVTDAVVKEKKGEYIKLETSSVLNKVLAAKTGKESSNTITVTMIKSYAGEAGVTPAEGETETKEYQVSCSIVADAQPATGATTTSSSAAGA